MTKGRTVPKFMKIYVDGYDMACQSRNIGPLDTTFQEGIDDPLCNAIVGSWLGQASISPGTLNLIFDNTSDTGSIDVLSSAATGRDVMVAIGIQAYPAVGDPVFVGQFRQDDYIGGPGETPVIATVRFGGTNSGAANLNYSEPWGTLLSANTAWTAPTTEDAVGLDQSAASALGGYMMYQVTAGDGNATILVEDSTSNNNADYGTLLTSGVLDCTSPKSGIVALTNPSAVKQYVRANVVMNTATTVTFALAFVRNYI